MGGLGRSLEFVIFHILGGLVIDKVARGLAELVQMFNFYVTVFWLNDVHSNVIPLVFRIIWSNKIFSLLIG